MAEAGPKRAVLPIVRGGFPARFREAACVFSTETDSPVRLAATGSWLARSAEGPKRSLTRIVKSVTFTEV